MKKLIYGCVLLFLLGCVTEEDTIDPDNLNIWINFQTQDGLISNNITTVFEADNDDLWIGTGAGIMRYTNGSFENFNSFNALAGEINAISEGNDGTIYAGSNSGLGVYQNGSWNLIDNISGNPLDVISLYTTNDGTLWIGSNALGLITLDNTGFTFFEIGGCVPCNLIFTFLEDTEGNLWFGTAGGAVLFDGSNLFFFNVGNGLLNDDNVLSIEEDDFGKIWVGTLGSDQVSMIDLELSTVIDVPLLNNLPASGIGTIESLNTGEIWMGANAGGLLMYNEGVVRTNFDAEGPGLAAVRSVLQGSDLNIWVGTGDQGLYQFIPN